MLGKLLFMTAVQGEPRPSNLEQGWTVDDSTFGARLALVRQRMRWNIKEAATECNLPAASWASWEAGSMPRRYADVCDKISQRTGADYIWLMAGQAGLRPRPPAIAHYVEMPTRTTDRQSRPRDNRPSGHPPHHPASGARRTAHLPRSAKPKSA